MGVISIGTIMQAKTESYVKVAFRSQFFLAIFLINRTNDPRSLTGTEHQNGISMFSAPY